MGQYQQAQYARLMQVRQYFPTVFLGSSPLFFIFSFFVLPLSTTSGGHVPVSHAGPDERTLGLNIRFQAASGSSRWPFACGVKRADGFNYWQFLSLCSPM